MTFKEKYDNLITRFGLSGSAIKILAMFLMTIDHTGMVLFYGTDAYWPMRIVGRLAFPIFAFLVAEGMAHTRDINNYALRMLAFAVLAEIPYNMTRNGQVFSLGSCNIFFTYFIPILLVAVIKKFEGHRWSNFITGISSVLAIGSAYIFNPDYGYIGVLIVLIFYYLRNAGIFRFLIAGVFMLVTWKSYQLVAIAALPILLLYNGKRGVIKSTFSKHSAYAFYPVHLLILYLIKIIFL